MTNRDQWASAFLRASTYPDSSENRIAIVAWAESEHSYTDHRPGAEWNPLDTTEPWAGATWYNDAGVRNYQSESDGIGATRTTLANGLYNQIRSTLLLSNNANAVCRFVHASPWGSKPTDELVNNVRAHYNRYASVIITGSSDTPPAPNPTPTPTPIVTTTPITGGPNVQRHHIEVPLDANGCGAVIMDGGVATTGVTAVSPAVHSSSVVSVDAEGSDPGRDHVYWKHSALWQDTNGFCLVTVVGGLPGGSAGVFVTTTS